VRGQVLLGPINPDQQAGLFGGGQLLEPGDGAAGDDQGMPRRDWVFVLDDGEEVVEGDQAGGCEPWPGLGC
jgi:hypothetical protein